MKQRHSRRASGRGLSALEIDRKRECTESPYIPRFTNKRKRIITIKTEVDPYLELAEIHRRVIDGRGPALLFERVKGSAYPVVTNFGTGSTLTGVWTKARSART